MKGLIKAVLVASTLSVPVFAFAQVDNVPVTRAEVKADLVRVEQAGYYPKGNDVYYPDDIQAAEAKIAAQRGAANATGVGGVAMTGTSKAGGAVAIRGAQSVYAHP
ncbi:DUF4148 domain-containing protein [Trinickia sp. NRRL B-1857]|uniref:DUF4148 domain-containing protein n=1 Tax=Trinickia sp. NRRL B-1857 TaxID=3162879 RepID=UPI003D27F4A5